MKNHKMIRTRIEVRFRDIDAMGHVNNAVFFTYFEEGRKAFLNQVLHIVDPVDYPFILARISCDYLRAVRLGDRPALDVWIGEIGEKRFHFKYRLVDSADESVIYGTGESVMVLYDYQNHRTVPVPDPIREKIQPYAENRAD